MQTRFPSQLDVPLWTEIIRLRDRYVRRRVLLHRIFAVGFSAGALVTLGSAAYALAGGLGAGVIVLMIGCSALFGGFAWLGFREARKLSSTTLLRDFAANPQVLLSWTISEVRSGVGAGPLSVHPLRQVFVFLIGADSSQEVFRIPGKMVADTNRLLTAHAASRG